MTHMKPRKLIIAIDETGQFSEQKLLGTPGGSKKKRKSASGMVAVLSSWGKKRLLQQFEQLAEDNGITYPKHFHARELLIGPRRRELGLDLKQAEAEAVVARVRDGMSEALEAVVGVRGRLPGRRFFHEQQAWGETLLALLHHLAEVEKERLAAAGEVWIYLASRMHDELTGFSDPAEYHRELCRYLERQVLPGLFPAGTQVVVDSATRDPFLMMADFYAAALGRTSQPWSTDLSQLRLPSSWDAAAVVLRRVDRVSAVMMKLIGGERVRSKELLGLEDQALYEALRRLTTMARGQVRDRHGSGDMDLALQMAELGWSVAELASASTIKGELCTIAAEVLSHQGRPTGDAEVERWKARSDELPSLAWASNLMAARAARLDNRCQTVQIDSFNVFDFEDVLIEFLDHLEAYERDAGGVEALAGGPDELYGKLLGTLGQSCGFLRPLDDALGAQAWDYLERSRPHFANSSPLFRAMNLGFRLTDLWDRGKLDEAASLMVAEELPRAPRADPYSLLHRLRLTSARAEAGLDHEPAEPLVARLLELCRDPATAGATPFDLCLKWALALDPDNPGLPSAASRWLEGLDRSQTAIMATSLPLLAQLGRDDQARANLETLLEWPGFATHWSSARAAPLARCLTDAVPPDHAALRAMPWNYA